MKFVYTFKQNVDTKQQYKEKILTSIDKCIFQYIVNPP